MPDANNFKGLYPFLLASFVLSLLTTAMTVGLVRGLFGVQYGLWPMIILGAAPVAWLVNYAAARSVVGATANWLCLSLPFALQGWLLWGFAFMAVIIGCYGFGECP